jgi:hypothetical protein
MRLHRDDRFVFDEKVRRERRWVSAGETPDRELDRSTRQPTNDTRVLAPDSCSAGPAIKY